MSTDQHAKDQDQVPDSDQVEQAAPGAEGGEVASGEDAAAAAEEGAASVDSASEEIAALKEKLLMAHADMQNLRRRAERDVENAHKFALERFVGDLLPVVDNLERALASAAGGNDVLKGVVEGVELTLKSFLDVLRRFQVEQVNPVGESFNPERHEAMAMVPNPEVPANSVIEVFQKGYLLNGRLVRPAMVVVSSGNGSGNN